jgi:hypothetical protein
MRSSLGFPWRRRASYSRPGSAAFISSVGKAAVYRVPGGAPPSCLRPEEEDDEAKRYWVAGLGRRWASARWAAAR